jgi:hypothetical protein
MKPFTERDFITYPRQFKAYRWYKPILTGLLFLVFLFITNMAVEYITKTVFGAVITDGGYDGMDFYTAAGFVIFGIHEIIYYLLPGRSGGDRFTAGGLVMLLVFLSLACIAEEILN